MKRRERATVIAAELSRAIEAGESFRLAPKGLWAGEGAAWCPGCGTAAWLDGPVVTCPKCGQGWVIFKRADPPAR